MAEFEWKIIWASDFHFDNTWDMELWLCSGSQINCGFLANSSSCLQLGHAKPRYENHQATGLHRFFTYLLTDLKYPRAYRNCKRGLHV